MLLESCEHSASCFVTLTYAENPVSLVPRHLTLFLKRLRKRRGSFRYFACGEYGERFGRPHYHAVLFGVSALEQEVIAAAWPHGYIHVGDLTRESAAYVTGYVSKKLTKASDSRLEGRAPEFARQSKGLGRGAIERLAAQFTTRVGCLSLEKTEADKGDVPRQIRMEGRLYPIGRYLTRKLRHGVGWSDRCPDGPQVERALELVTVEKREAAYQQAVARLKIQASKRSI